MRSHSRLTVPRRRSLKYESAISPVAIVFVLLVVVIIMSGFLTIYYEANEGIVTSTTQGSTESLTMITTSSVVLTQPSSSSTIEFVAGAISSASAYTSSSSTIVGSSSLGVVANNITYFSSQVNSSYSSTTNTCSSSNYSVAIAVSISDFQFTPNIIMLVLGVNNTVTWTNNDYAPHEVFSDNITTLDSGPLTNSMSFSFTFSSPGAYYYHCLLHPWMTGIMTVKST